MTNHLSAALMIFPRVIISMCFLL